MSISIMSQVEKLIKSKSIKLSAPTKYVFFILAKFADNNGKKIYPSHQTIADRTGYSVRTVQTHLKYLEESGFITKKHHFFHGHQTSNSYTINLDNLQAILNMQSRNLSKKIVDKSVDNPVHNSETRIVVGGAAVIDKSSDHDLYIKENSINIIERKVLYSELLRMGIYEREIGHMIKRYGLSKIVHIKRKVEDLIRKGKIIVRNIGAYFRKTLMNDINDGLKPLIQAAVERFNVGSCKATYGDKRESPQEFKALSDILKNIVPCS